MPHFRKKPMIVEAEQFFPDKPLPFHDLYPRIGVVMFDGTDWSVETIQGIRIRLNPGDWVIREPEEQRRAAYPNGEQRAYPCAPDVFEAIYELIQ